jgi:predicted nucleic acid-binding protein
VDRVFLDANVLFSAAYREGAGLMRLWRLDGVQLMTSGYAAEEARRNLADDAQRSRLADILRMTEVVPEADPRATVDEDRLPEKDRPILRAAVQARSTHLITGDVSHFGAFFGDHLQGVLILPPGDYLRSRTKG